MSTPRVREGGAGMIPARNPRGERAIAARAALNLPEKCT
jgi:hypothetical protein